MKVMKRAAALLVVLVIGLLSACSSTPPQRPGPRVTAPQEAHELTKQDVDAWLDGQLPDALQHGEIPGAVVTVVHNGQVLTNRGYGYAATGADGEEPQPVDPERTLFRIGSTSKLATGIAVMQLVEQGKIDLDADISTYVDVKIDRRFPGDITMRNLLTHTAGFEERGRGTFTQEQREPDLEEHILQDPPVQVFAPGTTPAYSNYGISLAGYIVQQVSGEKFENYLDKHVFEPAGMTSSTFHQPLPAELADRMAHGYQTNGGPAQPFEVVVSSPAGAMTTSGADAARFMLAQLGQSQGSPLLQDSTWQQMQSQASYTEPLGTLAKGDHMGLVYWDLSRNGHRIVGHGGDTLAFHTMLEIYPDDNTGVFISMNAAGKNGAPGTIREDLMRAFSDRYFPGEQTDAGKAPTAEESQQHATTVAGNYATTRSSYTTFLSTMNGLSSSWTNISALTNGHLLVKAEGATTEYEEIEPWVWREVGGSRRLPVQVEDGKVVRIGIAPAMSIAPVTPAQAALVPVVLASGAALLLLIIAWPVDGIRRWWTTRQGHAVLGGGPLTWKGHLARAGSLANLAAAVIMASFMMNISPLLQPSPLTIRGIQALSLLGVLAIIPATMDLIHVIRHKAGVRRIIGASLLLAGLAGLAWAAFAFHLLSLDISY